MKKYTGSFVLLFFFSSALFISPFIMSRSSGKNKNEQNKYLAKTNADSTLTVMDINNITSWVSSNGFMPALISGGYWNGAYPKGSAAGVIYQEGILWGGLVNDGASPLLRVNGNTYVSGTSQVSRIFRVRPDYSTADLTDDAANFFMESTSSVTPGQIDQIRAQYAKDWSEWPANSGAPFKDVDHDGTYNPNIDIPGISGASQTIWFSYVDSSSTSAYDSPPIGLKINETLWSYNIANQLANVIYKKVDLIYQGTPGSASNSTIQDMYIVQWADPDIGNYGDDYAGCDTLLNLGYAYNATPNDAVYSAISSPPPAAGYVFLQGVSQFTGDPADSAVRNLRWVHGYKAVNKRPLSTFIYISATSNWGDPAPHLYQGTSQWYSFMRGYQSYPYPIAFGFPINDSTTVGGNGTYLLSGDPVTGTGWIDGQLDTAADRRIINVTGPFNLALHDTAEIVVALVGGLGSSNLQSVTVLKNNASFATEKYFNLVDTLTDYTTGIENLSTAPPKFKLNQNYPNPFNPATLISYEIPKRSFVTIKVYDLLGRKVATLVNKQEIVGSHSVNFNGQNLSSGIYLYSITAGSFHQTKKMVLLK